MNVTAVFTQRLGQFDHLKMHLHALGISSKELPLYELSAPASWDAIDNAFFHRDKYDGFIFVSPFAISQTIGHWQQQIQKYNLQSSIDAKGKKYQTVQPHLSDNFKPYASFLWPDNFPPFAVMGKKSYETLISAGLNNQIILTPNSKPDFKYYKNNNSIAVVKDEEPTLSINRSKNSLPVSSRLQKKSAPYGNLSYQFNRGASYYNGLYYENGLKNNGLKESDLKENNLKESDLKAIQFNTIDNDSGSESLWPIIQHFYGGPEQLLGKRFALFRSEYGREWLTQQLTAKGACVDSIITYRRQILDWPNKVWQQIQLMLGKTHTHSQHVWLITSTEMLKHLIEKVQHCGNNEQSTSLLIEQLQSTPIIVTHKRIADIAHQHFFKTVRLCESNDQAIAAAFLQMTSI